MTLGEVQASLEEFAKHKNLLGLDVAQYNPDRDPDGAGARKIVDLLASVLSARLAALTPVAPLAAEETPSATA